MDSGIAIAGAGLLLSLGSLAVVAGVQPAEGERVSVQLTAKEVDAILAVVYESEGFRALNPEAEDVLEEDEAPEGEEKVEE